MRISDWSSDVCSSDLLALRAIIDDRRETADDHPLRVERHGFAHALHPGIAHHLLVRGVARRPVGIFEPAEHDGLVVLRLNRALEIIDLAVGHIVAPAFDHSAHAEFLEQRRRSEERSVGKEWLRPGSFRWFQYHYKYTTKVEST